MIWRNFAHTILGMHEIAGVVLMIVENEFTSFQRFQAANHDTMTEPDRNVTECLDKETTTGSHHDSTDANDDIDENTVKAEWFCGAQEDHIEMHTFYLFDQLMRSLQVIYAPTPKTSSQARDRAAAAAGSVGDNEDVLSMSSFLEYIQGIVSEDLSNVLWCGVTSVV